MPTQTEYPWSNCTWEGRHFLENAYLTFLPAGMFWIPVEPGIEFLTSSRNPYELVLAKSSLWYPTVTFTMLAEYTVGCHGFK